MSERLKTDQPVLSVRDLQVSFPSEAGRVDAVRGVSFDLTPGRTLALVGESGSGKSVTSMAIMGLLPGYADVRGSVLLGDRELVGLSDKEMSAIRGNDIGMIFQDPLSALTPVFSVGDQIVEAIRCHQDVSRAQAWEQAVELMDLVGIPDARRRAKAFPHEFSGGQRQRIVIAIAIANKPRVLIADEPTTALDVTIQAQILDLIKVAQRETNAATIMITHDMGVVAQTADDVVVMYAGRPVEKADVYEIFDNPKMPYTIGLLGSIPSITQRSAAALTTIEGAPPIVIDLPDECVFAQRCPIAQPECRVTEPALQPVASRQKGEKGAQNHRVACVRTHEIEGRQVEGEPIYTPRPAPEELLSDVPWKERDTVLTVQNLHKEFPLTKGAFLKRRVGTVEAVKSVSFDIRQGECVAIVGESGSGKTTTLLEVMELAPAHDTTVVLSGVDVATATAAQKRALRRDMQIVFQDPMGALDPRMTVADILREPLDSLGWGDGKDKQSRKQSKEERIAELMRLVGLNPAHGDRFPGQFSGGQRQRIAIARALATQPKLIVLDEPVSALDVSIQAGILNLLDELKARLGLSYLFIAHDLAVVRHISDRVAVMRRGEFVEFGPTDEVFDHPQHEYTKALLDAIPVPDPRQR